MWRAVRLVVDTGMHYKHWTRQQAIDYFLAHVATTEYNATSEVDRYISWPGQALAYKMGELKIKELCQRAEKELGAKFDIRAFHDALLLDGPLPLTVLEKQVNAWIAAQKTGNVGAGVLTLPGGAKPGRCPITELDSYARDRNLASFLPRPERPGRGNLQLHFQKRRQYPAVRSVHRRRSRRIPGPLRISPCRIPGSRRSDRRSVSSRWPRSSP